MQEAFSVLVQGATLLLPNDETTIPDVLGRDPKDTRIVGYACLQAPHIQKYMDR